jgi:hypothetical protein
VGAGTITQHHEKAAEHHKQAAKHHKEAVKYYDPATLKLQHTTPISPMDILNKRENKKWKLARNTR